MEKHEIVFEDLHGAPEVEGVVVDLDIEDNVKGITRVADDVKPDEKKRGSEANGLDTEGEEDDKHDEGEDGRAPLNAGDDDDDSQYSKNVRKRIDRERKLRKQEKEQAQYWKEQAEDAQRKLAETRRSVTKESLEAIDTQIQSAEKELEQAIEDGKSADQVRLTSKLTDLKARRITTEMAGESEAGSDKPDGSGRVRPSGGVNPLAKQWMNEQSDWYGRPGFERQSRLANRIDGELAAEGYDVRDPEYYEELTRRVRKRAPELFDSGRESRGRSPVAPVDRGGGERPRGLSSKVELNSEDFANMRNFGLDPNNPAHLKEYATNKRDSDSQEQQRREGARS